MLCAFVESATGMRDALRNPVSKEGSMTNRDSHQD